jgi:hypothetical protein
MFGYVPKSILKKPGNAIVIGASAEQVVSEETAVTAGGSIRCRVDILVSDVTVTTAITAKLQMRTFQDEWSDLAGANASVTITTDGQVSITQLIERSADQPNLPLKSFIRVVISTGTGDAVTVDKIIFLQPS